MARSEDTLNMMHVEFTLNEFWPYVRPWFKVIQYVLPKSIIYKQLIENILEQGTDGLQNPVFARESFLAISI